MVRWSRSVGGLLVLLACLGLVAAAAGWSRSWSAGAVAAASQDQPAATKTFVVTARKYAFSPARIEVQENDLVKITLETADIPHSFTVDAYRIAKRAAPRQPVVFEFRADQVGTFPFYCNLTTDEGCRGMRGELVVHPRK
jgi:heme/copper-type cytochrome/quinol oxidase subunit 2